MEKSPVPDWHRLAPEQAVSRLSSDAGRGLSSGEAARRLAEVGLNALDEQPGRSLLAMLFGQFADFMIGVLLAAALVSGLVGEPADTVAILVIVALNGLMGATQEYRAQRAMLALRRLAAPRRQRRARR